MTTDFKDRIVVALDTPDLAQAKKLVKILAGDLSFFKVGKELFISCGPQIIEMIKGEGGKVFLDLKLHDIPNTVSNAASVITKFGVDIFNVHASGGAAMMKKCVEVVNREAQEKGIVPPKILGVTVLTSLNDEIVKQELKWENNAAEQVILLAGLSQRAGLDGVVCSAQEITAIRETAGKDFIILTPGIRPEWAATDDQKRVLTPRRAFDLGADYIVIGRPITQHKDPKEAVQKILEEVLA